jgi:hypothetical protein
MALIGTGALECSIGYKTRDYRLRDRDRVRELLEVDLREISLVTLPMMDGTEVWAEPVMAPEAKGIAGLMAANCAIQVAAARLAVAARTRVHLRED